jgi:hypothetical protein
VKTIDRLANAVASRLLPRVAAMIDAACSRGRDALLLEGTYDPSDHTALVAMTRTAAAPAFAGNEQEIVRAVIAVPHIGDQTGPIGDEWGIAQRTASGWIFHPTHLPDDGHPESIAQNARPVPAGERWIGHRNPATKQYDVDVRWTNDGAVPGDGLGGFTAGGGSLVKFYTLGGLSLTLDDHANTATIAKGDLEIVIDFSGDAIGIGAASLDPAADAVVRKSDLDAALAQQTANTNTAFATQAARCAPGSGVAPATVTPATSTGSRTVRAKG